MNTRFISASDFRAVCHIMRAANVPPMRTRKDMRVFMESGGRIVVTHCEDGAIWSLIFYRVIEDWCGVAMERTVYCEAIVFQSVSPGEWEPAAKSIRIFLRSLLTYTHCSRAIMTVNRPNPVYLRQLEAIGFLVSPTNEICGCCLLMVFSHKPAHVGGVIIERILEGNATPYGEC